MPAPPFPAAVELNKDLSTTQARASDTCLPSQPQLCLQDTHHLKAFLTRDLRTPELDDLARRLWLISTPKPSNINPLHYQKVKNREIVLAEDPRLHLIWYHERIYMKPLPVYLLSHAFWRDYLSSSPTATDNSPSSLGSNRPPLECAALGFLRTYCYLIQHESDLRIAQQEHLQLIPPSVTWKQFCSLTAALQVSIEDQHVAPRYHYGEIRLSRLNLLVKIFLLQRNYQEVNPQYAEYFAQFYGPLLFIFGLMSVLLSAMQVSLGVEQLKPRDWEKLYGVCRWFSIVSLISLAVVMGWLVGLVLIKLLIELWYALKFQWRKRFARNIAAGKGRSGSTDKKQTGSV